MPSRAAAKTSKAAAKNSKTAKAPKKAGKSRVPARAKAAVTAGSLSKNGGGNGAPPRRKYRPFSDEESRALVVGVKRYGLGNWTRIHDDPDLPFMSTQRTPIDLKDKWRVLSKKLSHEELQEATPSGTEQAAGTPAALPPMYSREHLVLLPYHELVTLVLNWQAFHHHSLQQQEQQEQQQQQQRRQQQLQQYSVVGNGQQVARTIAGPNLQIPSEPGLLASLAVPHKRHPVPCKAEQNLAKAQSQKRRVKRGETNAANRMPPSATVASASQDVSTGASSTSASRAKRAKIDVNAEAAAKQMTMLSPSLAPAAPEHSPTPIGGSASTDSHDPVSGLSPGMSAAGCAPMSPTTFSPMSIPALQDPKRPMQRMSTVSVDRVLGRVTDGASNFPGRLPASGSLADPRASAGPKINLTSLANHSNEAANQGDGRAVGDPDASAVASVHQDEASNAALEVQQQRQQREQPQGGASPESAQRSNGSLHSMALSLSQSTERLNDRLNDSAVNVFPIGRSRSQEGFDTLRIVASRSVDELNNLAGSDSLADLASKSEEVGARITWHHQMQTGQAKSIEEWMPVTNDAKPNSLEQSSSAAE